MPTYKEFIKRHNTAESVWACLLTSVVEVGEYASRENVEGLNSFATYLATHLFDLGLRLEYDIARKLAAEHSFDEMLNSSADIDGGYNYQERN